MKKVIRVVAAAFATLIPGFVSAAETVDVVDAGAGFQYGVPAIAIAAAICIGMASFGGAIAQGRVATAAMEGISRNPEAASKVMTPMIIALALIESLVIYALVVAFLLQGKI
jgi:F-type H+-transporting ATPase subunit c